MAGVYENVIVPFDGTSTGRTALAPAADLAWRCGARIVIVNNTDASDKASRQAIKGRAMSLSGADVDFWVDLDHSLGTALVEAAKFRSRPIVCISVKAKQGGLRRAKRWSLPQLGEDVLRNSPVPVLVITQETDISRGLPMSEIVVATDGSPASEQILPLAVTWAHQLKLTLTMVGVIHTDAEDSAGEEAYLAEQVANIGPDVPDARYELVRAADPASGLVSYLAHHDDAVLAMSTFGRTGSGRGAVGSVAERMLAESPRAVLLARPAS
jgi:nucleotide-binding universal stress UspA family protein